MTTKAQRRLVASLADVKGRRRAGLFAVEGTKCVLDMLGAFELRHLYATPAWLDARGAALGGPVAPEAVSRAELTEMSSLSLASDVIAVFALPESAPFDPAMLAGKLTVALDRVQDPGNLGTIIRTADWMGVDTVLASADTADCFNPKTIQATMGALARVRVVYGPLPHMLAAAPCPVCGTFLDGENVYTADLPAAAVVLMGNEGRGISPEAAACVSRRLLIPSYPAGRPTSESLNVATATAITLAQFRAAAFRADGKD